MKNVTGTVAKTAMRMIINALFPPACPVCGRPAPFKNGIRQKMCENCVGKLAYIKSPRCMKCGKEITDNLKEYCYDCCKSTHRYSQGTAVFAYTDGIKQSIYRYKYKNRREYAMFYAQEISKTCKDTIKMWAPDAIIPIPLHFAKLKKRGFNQAELIAVRLGELLDIPVLTESLIRVRKTTPMKELSDVERRKNVENAFNINENSVKYKKIMLVDDIYTTGATIDACADILIEHGAENVYFVCLCIGKGF
jgi:ComF family protein